MQNTSKKGISPLIATVLLIGFVVVIAAAIWMWYGGVVTEYVEKQSARNQIKRDCVSVDLSLKSAELQQNNGKIKVDIENSGSQAIQGVLLVERCDGKSYTVDESILLEPGESQTITIAQRCSDEPDSIDVVPALVRQGVRDYCTGKKVSSSL